MTNTGSGRTLRCPNCDGKMREVERRGVVVDICTDCRGVFLDRGELDALVEAIEQVDELYSRQGPAPQAPPPGGYTPPPAPGGYQTPQHQGHAYAQQPQHGYQPQPAHGHQPGHPGKKDVVSEAMDLFQTVARERKHKGHSGHYGGHRKHKKGGLADFFDF
jgi:Zn-finger nucleic acid-binding protein